MHAATPTHKNNNNTKTKPKCRSGREFNSPMVLQHDCVVMIRWREDKEGGATWCLHTSLYVRLFTDTNYSDIVQHLISAADITRYRPIQIYAIVE